MSYVTKLNQIKHENRPETSLYAKKLDQTIRITETKNETIDDLNMFDIKQKSIEKDNMFPN